MSGLLPSKCLMLYDSASWQDERYPLQVLAELEEILLSIRLQVTRFDLTGDMGRIAEAAKIGGLVLNLCSAVKGDYSREAEVVRIMETYEMPFTGCSSRTLQLCAPRSEALLRGEEAGARLPETVPLDWFEQGRCRDGSFVVKHEYEHGYVYRMRTYCMNAEEVHRLLEKTPHDTELLRVERVVQGREIRVLSVHCANTAFHGYAMIKRRHPRDRGYGVPINPTSVNPHCREIAHKLDLVYGQPTIIAYDLILSSQDVVLIDVNPNPLLSGYK